MAGDAAEPAGHPEKGAHPFSMLLRVAVNRVVVRAPVT